MRKLLRVLQVEDSESDAALVLRHLQQGGYEVQSGRVETASQMRAAMAGQVWDIVIADYRLPQFDAPSALRVLHETGQDIPFIVVSGTMGEDVAVSMMKSGVHDYLMKGNLTRLTPAVERELGDARTRHARKLAEDGLRESAERLALALAAARMGVWEWDLVTNAVHWSPECYQMLGVTNFGGTFDAFAELVPPEDLAHVVEEARRAIEEKTDYSVEFRVLPPDGEVRWLWDLGQARYSADGQPLRLTGVVQDITDRKRAEEELQRSQAMLDSVVASTLDAVIVMDAEGSVVLWNRAAETMFGYPAAEAVGRRLHELVAPARFLADYQSGFSGFLKSSQGTVVGQVIELIAMKRDGTEFPVELGVAPLRLSGSLQAVGIVRDITERKQSESALRESEQRWQFALEGSGDGVWDWNTETNTIYYSRQWKAMLGCEEHEIADRTAEFYERVHPDDRETVIRTLEEYQAANNPTYSAEFRLRCKDSSYKWILSRGRAVSHTPDGRPLRVIGTHTDLTPLKAAEAEREKLRAQFLQAQKMESIGRLAGGIAHDFNNLLTVINGYSALVLARMERDNPIRESIEQIHGAGERATALVRQLLAFSRKDTATREMVDLNGLIENMGKIVLRLVGEDIRIATDLKSPLAPVMADRGQLEQVLMNLVVNARDAMPGGGTLTIETSQSWMEGICPHCNAEIRPGTYVHVAVRDTGTGMDDETRLHLFEPFFTTKVVGKGTGLGLAVVHGIVSQNGGHLSVESELGKGSVFHVHFPAVERTEEAESAAPYSAPRGTGTILLVEDEADVRRYAVQALESFGYLVLAVSSPQEALARLAAVPVDLLVTDIVMPDTSGRDLATRAKLLRPDLRVLFMSGYSGDRLASYEDVTAGEAFIQKPFLPSELAAKVRDVLRNRPPLARVLVVDDEPGIRGFLRSVLEPVGYEVKEAANGSLALEALRDWKPDLLITDLVMPEKEGLETIRTVRECYPAIRILAISGANGGRYLPVAEHLGAHGVLAKPVDPDALLAEVRAVLHG